MSHSNVRPLMSTESVAGMVSGLSLLSLFPTYWIVFTFMSYEHTHVVITILLFLYFCSYGCHRHLYCPSLVEQLCLCVCVYVCARACQCVCGACGACVCVSVCVWCERAVRVCVKIN